MRRYPNAPVTVFAVWQPMLPTDLSQPTSGTLARLSDKRARQYYDADHLMAKRLKEDARPPQPVPDCCTRKGILWDLMAIYPPGVRWTDEVPIAPFFNGTVVDVTDGLEKALTGKSGANSKVEVSRTQTLARTAAHESGWMLRRDAGPSVAKR